MSPPLSRRKRAVLNLNHFQSLHSNDPRTSTQQQEIYNELQSLKKEKEQLNYLDHTITEQEIRQTVKKLKNEKSPFVDKIRNEMIKASLESLMPVYIKLFNLILQSGKMPDNRRKQNSIFSLLQGCASRIHFKSPLI